MATKEQKKIWQRRWEEKYPEKQAAYRAKQIADHKEKYHTDPEFRKKQVEYSKQYFKTHKVEIAERRKKSPKYQEYMKQYNRSEKELDRSMKRRFGISLQEYNNILSRQEGKCAICGNEEREIDRRWNNRPKRLTVDHDHITLKVRGILCSQCNKGLGSFKDNPDTLLKAFEYLKNS